MFVVILGPLFSFTNWVTGCSYPFENECNVKAAAFMKPSSCMTAIVEQKTLISEERKELLRWNKDYFNDFWRNFSCQKLSQTKEWFFNGKRMTWLFWHGKLLQNFYLCPGQVIIICTSAYKKCPIFWKMYKTNIIDWKKSRVETSRA